jgi:2'-5' RNA ligase
MGTIQFLATLCPEADPLIGALRDRYDPSARRGLGAHITLLYPFQPSRPDAFEHLTTVAASLPRFAYNLDRVERFRGVIYLAPSPIEPFQHLVDRLQAAFPDFAQGHPQHPAFVPHVSVSRRGRRHRDAILVQLDNVLAEGPIHCHCHELVVLQRNEGPWCQIHHAPLS